MSSLIIVFKKKIALFFVFNSIITKCIIFFNFRFCFINVKIKCIATEERKKERKNNKKQSEYK